MSSIVVSGSSALTGCSVNKLLNKLTRNFTHPEHFGVHINVVIIEETQKFSICNEFLLLTDDDKRILVHSVVRVLGICHYLLKSLTFYYNIRSSSLMVVT